MALVRLSHGFLTILSILSLTKSMEISKTSQIVIAAAKNHHCTSINLIESRTNKQYDVLSTAKVVSKNLAASFLLSRIVTPEQFQTKKNGHHCSINVLLDAGLIYKGRLGILKNEKWLVFSHGNDTAEQVFADVHVPFDSEVSFVTSVHSEYLKVEEVYRVRSDYPLRIRHVDTVNPATLTLHEKSLIPEKTLRQNLEGLTFIAGSHYLEPTTYVTHQRNGESEEVEGYIGDVFKALAASTNFQFQIKWYNMAAGSFQTGNWSGLAGLLDREEIDVILTTFDMSPERMDIAAFPGTLLRSRFQVYMRPEKSHSTIKTLFKPLARDVWAALVMWILLCTSCLFVCLFLRKKYNLSEVDIRPTTFVYIFYFTIQTLCQQAYSHVSSVSSVRMILLVAFFTSSVLIPSYSASLISSLTKRVPVKPFSDLSELVIANYHLVVGQDRADYNLFTTSNDPLLQKIVEENLWPLNFSQAQDIPYETLFGYTCVQGVFGIRNVAVLADEREMDYHIKRFPSSLLKDGVVKMDEALSIIHQSFAFKKGSPYTDLFKYRITQMKEFGILSRFKKRYWPEENSVDQKFEGVKIDDMSPVFFGLLIGIFCSVLILLCEIYVNKRNAPKKFPFVN